MDNVFDNILEKDEKIVKIIKPNKKRYWKTAIVSCSIPLFWPHLLVILIFTLFTLPHFYGKGYENLYYAYTNKRIIKKSGWINITYSSLEYKDITASSVNVGFLDKGLNTGTLIFMNPSAHHGDGMNLSYIENPYETMKEIKSLIDNVK